MYTVNAISLFLLLLGCQVSCRDLHYIYNYHQTSYYQCVQKSGFDHVILPIEATYPEISESSVQNVINAKSAGLDLDILFIPCRLRGPQAQIQLIVKSIGAGIISRFWVFPNTDESNQCSWGKYSAEENCLYLQRLNLASKSLGITFGVAADISDWTVAFGSPAGCPEISFAPLWWLPLETEQSQKPDFKYYSKIGGWSNPYMKLYSQSYICGDQTIANYYA